MLGIGVSASSPRRNGKVNDLGDHRNSCRCCATCMSRALHRWITPAGNPPHQLNTWVAPAIRHAPFSGRALCRQTVRGDHRAHLLHKRADSGTSPLVRMRENPDPKFTRRFGFGRPFQIRIAVNHERRRYRRTQSGTSRLTLALDQVETDSATRVRHSFVQPACLRRVRQGFIETEPVVPAQVSPAPHPCQCAAGVCRRSDLRKLLIAA